jgi:hypothetical protein
VSSGSVFVRTNAAKPLMDSTVVRGRNRVVTRKVFISCFCLALMVTLGACGNSSKPTLGETLVVDPKDQLTTSTRQLFAGLAVPDNHVLIVAVVDFDESKPVGPQADRSMSKLTAGCKSKKRCRERGMFVLVDSALGVPQLRVGSKLALGSMWGGATYGPTYVAAQRSAASLSPSAQAESFVPWALKAVTDATRNLSWFEKWGSRGQGAGYGNFAKDLIASSFPGSGYYDHWLVRPFLSVQVFERRHIGTWFISIILSFVLMLGIRRVVDALAKAFRQTWLSWVGFVLNVIVSVVVWIASIPMSAAMILQSGARMEDAHDVQIAFGALPAIRLWSAAWAPSRLVWVSVTVAIVGFVSAALALLGRLGVYGLSASKTQDFLCAEDLVPEWEAFVSDQIATDDRTYFTLVVPIIVGIAAYGVLPVSLVMATLIGWVLRIGFSGLDNLHTIKHAKALDRFVEDGTPFVVPPIHGSRRLVLGAAAVCASLAIGGLSSFAPSATANSTKPSAQGSTGPSALTTLPSSSTASTTPVAVLPVATTNEPSGDLNLSQPMSRPECDGQFIVILASAIDPDRYAEETQTALTSLPSALYLRTDKTCPSLRASVDGIHPIYSVYFGPYLTKEQACEDRNTMGGDSYVKVLDNSTPPTAKFGCDE